ncbi:hypothetical protein SDC9_69867 [bioreactor metagenome]|uniref:Uncharacterized protein n=1 Tax=bioreactor metagenome TaxID=1076179 RepID=A0A644Y486_9ZZZZ
MAAAAVIIEAVVTDISWIVGLSGTHQLLHLAVVLGARIAVADDRRKRAACRHVVEVAAQDFRLIFFFPWRRQSSLAWRSPFHFFQNFIHIYFMAWRQTVDGDTDCGPM